MKIQRLQYFEENAKAKNEKRGIPSPRHCHSLPNPVLPKAQQVIQLIKNTQKNGVSYKITNRRKKE